MKSLWHPGNKALHWPKHYISDDKKGRKTVSENAIPVCRCVSVYEFISGHEGNRFPHYYQWSAERSWRSVCLKSGNDSFQRNNKTDDKFLVSRIFFKLSYILVKLLCVSSQWQRAYMWNLTEPSKETLCSQQRKKNWNAGRDVRALRIQS